MRKLFIFGGLLVFFIIGIMTWRRLHPPLSDEGQIIAAIFDIRAAANARSPRGIANYLAKDFKFGETSKADFQNSLVGAMLQYRVVDLQIPSVAIGVKGETARCDGRYILSLKSEFNSPPEIFAGKFTLKWRKDNGQWLVTNAQGEQIPN